MVVRCEGTADVKHQVFSRADKESDRESLSAVIDTETEGSGDFVVFVIILRMETRESGCCRSGPVDTVLQIPLSAENWFCRLLISVRLAAMFAVLLSISRRFVAMFVVLF